MGIDGPPDGASPAQRRDADPLLADDKAWRVVAGRQPVGDAWPGSERGWKVPELYVTGHDAARALSALLAVCIAVGVVVWIQEARDRFDVPALVCDGCAPPDWLRWTQLIMAAVGVIAALVVVVYMVHFAVREIVWRRWREASIVFGVLAATWTLMWWIDYLWI